MTEPQRYRYDVFISYSQDDREWVWGWLLPRLEAAGLSVCLDESCFEPGAPRAEETERVVRESRRSLVILSPALVASQWDQFEALLVHAQDPAAGGRRLIPLLLKPCDPPERIKLLQWVDFSDPARQESQLKRVIDAVQGKATLPELRPEAAFPSPKQRRGELRWFAVAGVAAVLTLSLLVGWIWSQNRCEPTMPEKQFNVAVAEFRVVDQEGQPVKSQEGREWSQQVEEFLKGEEVALRELAEQPVNIWGPSRLCKLDVSDQNARVVAKKIGATVLLYGELRRESDGREILAPMLSLNDEADSVRQLASELEGPEAMGVPIAISRDLAGPTDVNDTLRRRMRALAPLLIGLARFGRGNAQAYEAAINDFESATETEWGQQSGEGQEILYLFLGNAYSSYAAFVEEEDPAQRKALIETGLERFKKALNLNPNYPRAYNGLAFTLFQAARPSLEGDDCDWDWDKLAEAYDNHQLAQQTVFEPNSGDVEFRARWGMGLVRYFQGLCPNSPEWNADADPWTEAQDHFDFVLQEYEKNPAKSRILPAASTYAHRGHIWLDSGRHELCMGELPQNEIESYLDRAIDEYDQAAATARLNGTEEAQQLIDEIPLLLQEAQCFRANLSDSDVFLRCNPKEGNPCP